MKTILEKLKAISKVQIFALVLIAIGIAIMIPKGRGMRDSYNEVEYAVENDFASGNLSTDLLRPWMTIRYISAAYAVPQKYLFEATDIQPKKETSLVAISRLNRKMGLGEINGSPVLMIQIADAIEAYRANPVVTGLIERNVEDWMTIQYIANSTGIPVETIFEEIGVPAEGNAYITLGFLSDELSYPGGPEGLVSAIQEVVDSQDTVP